MQIPISTILLLGIFKSIYLKNNTFIQVFCLKNPCPNEIILTKWIFYNISIGKHTFVKRVCYLIGG